MLSKDKQILDISNQIQICQLKRQIGSSSMGANDVDTAQRYRL